MVLSIKDPEADRLARELASCTGRTITQAVIDALQEKLEREARQRMNIENKLREIDEITLRYHSLPKYDTRSLEDLLYDENGLPV